MTTTIPKPGENADRLIAALRERVDMECAARMRRDEVFEGLIVSALKPKARPTRMADVERDTITSMLAQCGGNKTVTAKRLGFSQSGFWGKCKRLGIVTIFLMSAMLSFGQLNLVPKMAALAPVQPEQFSSAQVEASWVRPTNMTGIAAFRLSWGTNLLNNSTQVGTGVTNVTVKGLLELVRYNFAVASVGTNGVEFSPATNSVVTQPKWVTGSYVTYFQTRLQPGRTNIVQSSTNGGSTWTSLSTNTSGGTITLLRTNGLSPVAETFRVKP